MNRTVPNTHQFDGVIGGKLDGKVAVITGGSNASLGASPGWSRYARSKAVQQVWARVWLNELRDRKIRVNVLTPGQVATAKQEELFDEPPRMSIRAGREHTS